MSAAAAVVVWNYEDVLKDALKYYEGDWVIGNFPERSRKYVLLELWPPDLLATQGRKVTYIAFSFKHPDFEDLAMKSLG